MKTFLIISLLLLIGCNSHSDEPALIGGYARTKHLRFAVHGATQYGGFSASLWARGKWYEDDLEYGNVWARSHWSCFENTVAEAVNCVVRKHLSGEPGQVVTYYSFHG